MRNSSLLTGLLIIDEHLWTVYAGALFETMQREDKFTPYLPDHEEVPELEALIDEVYEANETDTQKPQQREAEI
ncbi:hypothetical protein ACUY3S_11030 [Corynebacterium resistens]